MEEWKSTYMPPLNFKTIYGCRLYDCMQTGNEVGAIGAHTV